MNALVSFQKESDSRGPVVLKFGGTSVEDADAFCRVVRIVRSRLNSHPVIVVSALAKVTDQLLSAAQAAAEAKVEFSNASVAAIRLRHRRIADELLPPEKCAALQEELEVEFRQLNLQLCEVAGAGRLSPRAQDAILSFGERLSSLLLAAILQAHGLDAAHFDAAPAIVTDARHTHANPDWGRSYQNLAAGLNPLLRAGQVPVLGGFIATNLEGLPTTLGRGGSDLTASIVGAALQARRVEIWTDVDGIMTADPNVCPDARRIPQISFEDAAELAHFGAKVLHHTTLVPAMRANIPVHVLNSHNPECQGTEICTRVNGSGPVRGLTAKRGVAAVEIDINDDMNPNFVRIVYDAFDRHDCAVDLMAASHRRLSLLVGSTAALPAIAADLRGTASLTWENHKALVCLVGDNLRRQPELASRTFAAVSDMDLRVVCQGASDRTLSFLVEEDRADESVRRLHDVFFSDRKQPASARSCSAALCQAGESWL